MKFIRGTRTREGLILCTGLRADQIFRMASQQKTDERMIAASSDELVAKEAYASGPLIKVLLETSSVTEIQKSTVIISLVLLKK